VSQPVPARLPCRQLRFLPRFARSCSICLRRLFQELLFSCHGVAENGFDVRRFFSQQSSNAVDQRSKKYTQQNDHTPHGESKRNRAKKKKITRGAPHSVPGQWSNSGSTVNPLSRILAMWPDFDKPPKPRRKSLRNHWDVRAAMMSSERLARLRDGPAWWPAARHRPR
jgi:hypothetical protein